MVEATDTRGPFVTAATFCEKALQETDGVVSIIRVIDRYIVTPQILGFPADFVMPDPPPPPVIATTLVVMLKSGDIQGTRRMTFELVNPVGERSQIADPIDVLFQGDDRGVNIVAAITLVANHEGLSWVDIGCAGRLLTRIPVRVERALLADSQKSGS